MEKTRILVDHEYYGKKDKTNIIIKSLLDYKKTTDKNIEIIQINTESKNGYCEIKSTDDIKPYNRMKATSFKNIYAVYKTCDIFCVTHEEALGLSCIECNQAGCRVVAPDNYIKRNMFEEYLDILYIKDDKYDWDNIINNLDPKATNKKVRSMTYENAIRRIFKRCKF